MNRRSSQPSLRDQQREVARNAILDAAEELIAAKGLHAAALVDIARRAGVAVGTLYNYFDDRDALVKALFETRRATLRPLVLDAIARSRGQKFEPRLRTLLSEMFQIYEGHRSFLKLAIETEHLRTNNRTATDMQAALDEIVAEGVAQKQLAPELAELVTVAIWGTIKATILARVADGRPIAGTSDPIVTLILNGART